LQEFSYGSREWANIALRLAIQDLKNTDRVLQARQIEIYHILKELQAYGWKWQTDRLRNQIHLAIKRGSFTASAEADSLKREEDSLS
jgi:hypothetical protein